MRPILEDEKSQPENTEPRMPCSMMTSLWNVRTLNASGRRRLRYA